MAAPLITQGEKRPHGYQYGQIQQFTPEMMELFQQMIAQLGPDSFLAKLAGGDQSAFEQMERPALKQFNELQGGMASRFSAGGGAGSLSARNSSGFRNQSNQAATDFAQQLQSQRTGLQRQALLDMQGMANQLLGQRPYEQFLVEKQQKKSPWGSIIGTGVGGAAGFFGSGGNPLGALKGAQMGNQIGSSF